jgi:hypothetical protein
VEESGRGFLRGRLQGVGEVRWKASLVGVFNARTLVGGPFPILAGRCGRAGAAQHDESSDIAAVEQAP